MRPPMTIRDLGYRPYDGPRLPASNNTWVMLRQGLRRAWGSWLVKLATFFSLGPPLVYGAIVFGLRYFLREQIALDAEADPVNAADILRGVINVQTWVFVSMITVGAGAPAIAEDLTFKAFQFYFAKPVTPAQYLAGRTLAVGLWCFGIAFVPSLLVGLIIVGTAPAGVVGEQAALMLPVLLYCLILATVMAAGSVSISSLSKSRALTMSAWLVLFIVPHVLASIVDAIAHATGDENGWPWLYLGSFTGLLGVVRDALFKIESDSELEWWHAAPILTALVVGAIALTMHRLKRAEVIT